MTCHELIDFLDDYVDGGLPAAVRQTFEDHLAECEACRDYLRGYRETVRLARSLGEESTPCAATAPAELIAAVLAALRKS